MNALLDGVLVFMDHWRLTMGILGFAVIFLLPLFPRFKRGLEPASTSTGFLAALFFALSLFLRLAYVSRALFPSYFDSAQHYAMIKTITVEGFPGAFDLLRADYYHMGFHFLAAFFVEVFQVDITATMLVLGQVVLALLPLPVWFIVQRVTASSRAGMFAAALAALGWYMPAHAVDWGKYPALLSLLLVSYAISLLLLLPQYRTKRWMFYGLAGVGVLASIFAHSRALVVFGIILLSWGLATGWSALSRSLQRPLCLMLPVALFVEVVIVQRNDVLSLLLDPYLGRGIWITCLVGLLSFFALMAHPRWTLAILLAVCLLIASLFIPMNRLLPGRPQLTLLDRPYVEMILYLPLSLLGGLGLGGLGKMLQGRFLWGRQVGLLAIGVVAINAFFTYDLYPSDCCVIVGNDDVLAMDWVADQLPVEARIGIASTELKVMASEASEGEVGADAGIWIAPLTGRVTIPLPNTSAFDQESTLKSLCELGIGYLFMGETGQPFDADSILAHPEWYRPLLSMPKTGVYEVIGCN